MPTGPVTVTAAFVLAYLAGVAAVWLALGAVVMAFFRGPDTDLPLLVLALPLLGLAIFQLIFTRLTGLWRGDRFWLVAIPATYATGFLAMLSSMRDWLPAPIALPLGLVLLGGVGLWRARLTPPGTAS